MLLSKRHTRFARRVSRGRIVVNLLACQGGVARRGDVTSGSRRKSPCHGIRDRGIFPLSCLTLSSPPSCSSSCGSSGRTTTASGSWRIRLTTSRSCATPFSASSPRWDPGCARSAATSETARCSGSIATFGSRGTRARKTHAAAHFPHAASNRDVHAPGFYLHLEPGHCFAAAGLWHPDATTLERVRERIAHRPSAWQAVLRRRLPIDGERLSRPPRGYDPTHPYIEDLKLKDFITRVAFPDAAVRSPGFPRAFVRACTTMSPLMAFLTRALNLAW